MSVLLALIMSAVVWATLDYWPLDIVSVLFPNIEYGLATTDEMPFEGFPSPKSLDEPVERAHPAPYRPMNALDNPNFFHDTPAEDKRLALLMGAAVLTYVTIKVIVKVIRALSG